MKKLPLIGALALLLFAGAAIFCFHNQPSANNKIYHWEVSSHYAIFRISAVGDSIRIQPQISDLEAWAFAFTKKYKTNGELDLKVYNAQEGDTIRLDSTAYRIFAFALQFREFSHGDIDVGIGNLLQSYKDEFAANASFPHDSLIAFHVKDIQTPFYDTLPTQQAIRILKPQHHFALGAFLEGVILDEMERRLRVAGATSWLVEVSGDFAYHGLKPDSTSWVLGIKDPAQPEQLLAVHRTLPDRTGFCTSGDYEQQYVTTSGKKGHHILNPHTGYPTQGKHSVSVSTTIPWMNRNTLCTWFMVLPFPELQQVVRDSKGQIEALVVLDSNRVWMSEGFKPRTEILLDQYKIIP